MWSKLVIDMKALTVCREPLDEELLELGGRALIAQYLIKNVPPQCEPLGSLNQLIICTSVFAGTKLTTAHRLSVGGKSPLTGGIKESNSGGYAAALLAEQGIRLIVVKEQPTVNDSLWLLHIDPKGNACLEDAGMYEGINNYEFVDKMHERFGNNLASISIGSAGERLYRNSSIQISEFGLGHPSRAAARGGLAAVM
ncbi:MAG: aldehyde ferredoxin oxidoreductase N-terminal domain-containing protein, partial [Pseudomonadota bacterium]